MRWSSDNIKYKQPEELVLVHQYIYQRKGMLLSLEQFNSSSAY